MEISKQKQVNEVASRGKCINVLLLERRRMMYEESSLERVKQESSGEQEDINEVASRGKHMNESSSFCLGEKENRCFSGNNYESSKETPSESTSSRKRKGASDNSESRKLKRTVSTNQDGSNENIQQHNVGKHLGLQGKQSGLTRRFMDAEVTETDVATDDYSDTICNEKEVLIQFLLDFKALFPDGTYRDYLRREKVNITKLQNFLRERGCSTEDLSSYEFTMLQYLTLEEEDLILEEGEKKKYRKPRSDCACGFKNSILEDSTPAEFIANNFMFKNDNTSVCRHEISMEDLFKLYRFLALDKSLSQEHIVTQIRKATAELCNEYGCGYFLYSFLQKSGGSEKTLQGLIDVGIVQKEDLEKNNVYFGTLLLPFLQTHACLKILIEWYPDHLRPSDIVKSVQPNEKDSSVVSVDDLKLLFTLAKKHFPQWLGFLLETDKSQNRSSSGMESRGHDFHTSPCREICNMKTKHNEALEAIIGCLDEADLSLLADMVKELHDVGRRREAKTCDYIQKELGARIDKSKCEHTHLMKSVVHTKAGENNITNVAESSKMTRNSFDRQAFESVLDQSSKRVSKQSSNAFKMRMESLRNFKTEHGHFKVRNKINKPLFQWVQEVKKSYQVARQGKVSSGWKLTRERYNELVSIGFPFESICLPATASSAVSSSSKSKIEKLNEKVHTASKPKCPLAQDGNSVSENKKQDVEYICNESYKYNQKTESTTMAEASVEIHKKLKEKEYVHNTLASSNGTVKQKPSIADTVEKVHIASEDTLSIAQGESNTSEKEKKDNTESLKSAEILNSNDLCQEVSPDEGGSGASILPRNHTEALVKRIKKLVSKWADDNKTCYWNIMNNQNMDTIASKVPLSIEELKELGVLEESVVKEYGDSLIKHLNAFIDQNDLHKYIKVRESKRRKIEKTTHSATVTNKTHKVKASPNKSSQKSRIGNRATSQPEQQGIDYQAEKSLCSESLMTSYSPKQKCNEILMENRPVDSRLNEMKEEYATIIRKKNEEIRIRRELENRLILQDQESEAAQMKKEDKINELVTENSSLQKKLVDMKMTLMEKDKQITELVIEKSSLEQQLKSEKYQHDETKRKLTDRVIKADEKRELQKKTEKRLMEENKSLRCKALKSDNQKLVDQNKSLKESSAANTTSLSSSKEHSLLKRMITKKDEELNEMEDRLQILFASNKEVIDKNEQLRQKLEEFEQLKKFKSGLQEKLVCPVCLKGMKNPQMTKCGHRFCKTCIEKEIRKAVPYGREKRCPTCRDPIVSKRDLRKDEPFLEGIIDMVLLECFQDDSETEKEKESKAKSQNIYDL